MDHNKRARWKLCSSMVVFGTLGLFTRQIALSSGALALCRAVLAAALILLYFAVTGRRINIRGIGKELPLLFLSGAAMGINWILLFQAYRYTTISAATLSYYFAPVLVTVLCPFLFHEKLSGKQILCFVMSTLGLILITGIGNLSQGGSHLLGVLCGLLAAAFYAAVILLNKFIRQVEGIQRTLFQFFAAILVLIPYVAAEGGLQLSALSGMGLLCLLIVGLFHTGITYCLYFSALKDLRGQEAAILSYIDPLVAVFVSVLLLGEQLTVLQAAGGLLILGFTLWNELS